MKKQTRGFTLIELMVAITIIGLLSATIAVSLNSSRKQGRDAKRYADLAQVQVALELYKSAKGSYPDTSSNWQSSCVTTSYISGISPTYIIKLPVDANGCTGGGLHGGGYIYKSNGTDYKFAADNTVEVGTKCFTGETYSDNISSRQKAKGATGPFFCSVYTAGTTGAGW